MNLETTNSDSTPSARCEVCSLNRVQCGVAVRIKQLCAAPEIQNRLREIGLCEDQVIRLVTSRNNFICQVCNSRLAISEQLAQLIMVEPVLAKAPINRR
jgi:Fe2+ transport system protein FeoA